jgi:hypothetical protein
VNRRSNTAFLLVRHLSLYIGLASGLLGYLIVTNLDASLTTKNAASTGAIVLGILT